MTELVPEIPMYRAGEPLGLLREMQSDPVEFFIRVMHQYRPIARAKVAHLEAVFLFDPNDIEGVLVARQKAYQKDERSHRGLKRLLGDGLLTSEGARWLAERRRIQGQLSASFEDTFQPMREEAEALVARVCARADRSPLESFDIGDELNHTTLVIVGKAMLGVDLGPRADLVRGALSEVLTTAQEHTNSLLPFAELWPTPKNIRARASRKQLNIEVDRIIDTRRASDGGGTDILGALLAARDENGESMPISLLRDQVMTLMVAGHETSALGLSWALYLLSKHPAVRALVEAEIDQVLGDGPVTLEGVRSLHYLEQVIYEVMRLYPPIWAMSRIAIEEDELAGRRIEKGTRIFMSTHAVHRSPDLWENPEAFDPSRFAGAASRSRPKYAYFPFGGGSRKCMGERFAILELMTVLAILLREVRIDLRPGFKATPRAAITLQPAEGMWVRARRRKKEPR